LPFSCSKLAGWIAVEKRRKMQRLRLPSRNGTAWKEKMSEVAGTLRVPSAMSFYKGILGKG
jgi:hypothetical protein